VKKQPRTVFSKKISIQFHQQNLSLICLLKFAKRCLQFAQFVSKKTSHPVRSKNQRVHEIDPSRQFHQRFMREFFVRKSFRQLFSTNVLAKKHFRMKKKRVKC